MSRLEFMQDLHKRLTKLPVEEYESAMRYYNEYFDDAGVENEYKVIEELGSPQRVAAQIMADYAIKDLGDKPQSAKKGISTVWVVLASVFAMPIALPLAIAFAAVGFALAICIFAIFLSFAIVGIALIAVGAACFIAGICVITQSLATTLFFCGTGMVVAGLGILFSMMIVSLSKKCFGSMAKFYYNHINKRRAGVLNG